MKNLWRRIKKYKNRMDEVPKSEKEEATFH